MRQQLDLPADLQPSGTTEIHLSQRSVILPVCRPTFLRWHGAPVGFTYGNKLILEYKGEACFAELLIVRLLRENGWEAVWVAAFGGTHFLQAMPMGWALQSEHVPLPAEKDELLQKIWRTAKTTACFDVF